MLLGMDTEALISAVYVRRPVWDKKHKLHCNRSIIERCWRDISAEMNEEEFKLRKRWKYLRDQFAIELGKAMSSCRDNNLLSKWPYFSLLSFLRDVVKPRMVFRSANSGDGVFDSPEKLESPAKSPEAILGYSVETETSSSVQEVDYQEYTLTEDNVDEQDAAEFVTVGGKKRKHNDMDPFACVTPKLQYVQEMLSRNDDQVVDDDDEHLSFFKSVIPHVKKIPRAQILSFRNRINELVEMYVYDESSESQNIYLNSDSILSAENPPGTSKSFNNSVRQ